MRMGMARSLKKVGGANVRKHAAICQRYIHVRPTADSKREAYDLRYACNVLFTMTQSNDQLKAAQVRWELNLAILQEEERRLFSMLEEQSRESATLPPEVLDRLKAARSQCNEAFKRLMGTIEDRVTHAASTQGADRQDDATG
jgi:hypothetical protein